MKYIHKGFTLIELMIVVAIIGILASVAITSYTDYTARAQASEAFALMDGFKTPLSELFESSARFSIGGPSGVIGTTTGKYVESIMTGGVNGKDFSLVAKFKPPGSAISSRIAGMSVHMYFNPNGGWSCANGDGTNDDPTTLSGVDSTSPASSVVANLGANPIPVNILPKSCG